MSDDDSLLLRSRLTIHRQLNPNYRAAVSKSPELKDDDDDDLLSDSENWERTGTGGNVVAKRNARERTRVHTVNQAFLILKTHLPSLRSHTKRVSKLKILRAAINYIDALLNLLKKEDGHLPVRGSHMNSIQSIPMKQHNIPQTSVMADRSLAAPVPYSVNGIQNVLLDNHTYIYSTHPHPVHQPQLIHPFLINSYN